MIFFRTIFGELISPFLLTLSVTTFVLMMGKIYNLINLMVERHVAFGEGALMFAFLLPQSITVMVPMGVLGAVIIVAIRQSTDSEVTAMRAAGLSLWRYMAPMAAFGLAGVALTSVLTLWLQPAANRGFLDLQVRIIQEHAEEAIIPGELNFDFGDKVIRVGERLPNKEVRSVFLADREIRPGSPIVVAERGRIVVDQTRHQVVFRLEDGWMYTEDPDPSIVNGTSFRNLDYVLALGGGGRIDTREVELRWSYSTPELLAKMETEPNRRSRQRDLLELYMRLTPPWSCLAFALAGAPLGLLNPRSGRTGGILRALALVVVYYVIWIGCRDLILSETAHPSILFAASAGIALFGLARLWRINSATG